MQQFLSSNSHAVNRSGLYGRLDPYKTYSGGSYRQGSGYYNSNAGRAGYESQNARRNYNYNDPRLQNQSYYGSQRISGDPYANSRTLDQASSYTDPRLPSEGGTYRQSESQTSYYPSPSQSEQIGEAGQSSSSYQSSGQSSSATSGQYGSSSGSATSGQYGSSSLGSSQDSNQPISSYESSQSGSYQSGPSATYQNGQSGSYQSGQSGTYQSGSSGSYQDGQSRSAESSQSRSYQGGSSQSGQSGSYQSRSRSSSSQSEQYGSSGGSNQLSSESRSSANGQYDTSARRAPYGSSPYQSTRPYSSNYDIFDAPGSAYGPKNGSERCIPKCFAQKGDRVSAWYQLFPFRHLIIFLYFFFV